MPETSLVKLIQVALSELGVRLFRNNVGALKDKSGRWVQFGLCPGSSDLVGWRTITVTPAMVGKKVAIFCAIEVKGKGSKTHPKRLEEQKRFIEPVSMSGGLAMFTDNLNETI